MWLEYNGVLHDERFKGQAESTADWKHITALTFLGDGVGRTMATSGSLCAILGGGGRGGTKLCFFLS